MRILGIETSCDETSAAVYDSGIGLLSCETYSQDVHRHFGGVVPELASRDHIAKIVPIVDQALAQAQTTSADLGAIAYTAGPGLIGALLVGATFAQSLAYAWHIPAVAVHHLEGHLLAPLLDDPKPEPPFVALLVSGGHTQLLQVNALTEYEMLGETLDDAAGEAFDKIAKMLDLGYPGGPALAQYAQKGRPGAYHFTRPMLNRPGLDFSFSGLKTQVATTIKRLQLTDQLRADIAYAAEDAITDALVIKSQRALAATQCKTLVVSGGVSANLVLRAKLTQLLSSLQGKVYYPRLDLCTDNGAMIAYAGYQRLRLQKCFPDKGVKARWPLVTE